MLARSDSLVAHFSISLFMGFILLSVSLFNFSITTTTVCPCSLFNFNVFPVSPASPMTIDSSRELDAGSDLLLLSATDFSLSSSLCLYLSDGERISSRL